MMTLLPLPNLPQRFHLESPAITAVLDEIRGKLDDKEHGEFYWFVREYPRFYRSQLFHAQYRLERIYGQYSTLREHYNSREGEFQKEGFIGVAISNREVDIIYWEFEAFLSAINTSLELIARILITAFKDDTPISFNKLCAKKDLVGPVEVLREAKYRWVDRMKEYRDCFVHFSGVDTLQRVGFNLYSDGVEMRAKIPANPEVREQDGFRFLRKGDVLRYAISVFRNARTLDRKIAKLIMNQFKEGLYPVRTERLHFIAPRHKKSRTKRCTQ